jgi:hypothetical protein
MAAFYSTQSDACMQFARGGDFDAIWDAATTTMHVCVPCIPKFAPNAAFLLCARVLSAGARLKLRSGEESTVAGHSAESWEVSTC